MTLDMSLLKSYVRQKFLKAGRRRTRTQTSTPTEDLNEKPQQHLSPPAAAPQVEIVPDTTLPNAQQSSPFFQKLPPELRKMIYAQVWQGDYDEMYHEARGRHLHFKNGRWVHTRCVMSQGDDADLDLIQTQMDRIYHQRGPGDIFAWQRRLTSTWGQRHWRCEERVEHGGPTAIDRTDLGALMVVCKRMHPEVMASFLETHKLIFNDLYSAYRFLVRAPSAQHLMHMRHIDVTLSVPFHWYAPFISNSTKPTTTNHIAAILDAIATETTCLHSVRICLDVYDRGPWRELPERGLAAALRRIAVRRGGDYVVELPPVLPVRGHGACLDDDEDEENPFRVVRRPALRFWQFHPGEVENFTWETTGECDGEEEEEGCVAVGKTTRYVANLYPVGGFVER